MYSISDYDYILPEGLIAQEPENRRDCARLLCLDKETGDQQHRYFHELPLMLSAGDILVVNNTAVIPGRLYGCKETGGKAEVLILDFADGKKNGETGEIFQCRCLVKTSKPPKIGSRIDFEDGLTARVIRGESGEYSLRFFSEIDFEILIDRIGEVPLPPYIKRDRGKTTGSDDRQAYQTVYAEKKGAVAAPTAGLHFTHRLMEEIRKSGVKIVAITLHVGYGTFLPVRVDDIRAHQMHAEWFHIPAETAAAVNRVRQSGGRVIAVGTTCVRTLEYRSDENGVVAPGGGQCDLFIYPGYRFKAVDAMITNFHLPRSTLLMLVSAFAGRENILTAYRVAVERGYRFYSYGDAMFIGSIG